MVAAAAVQGSAPFRVTERRDLFRLGPGYWYSRIYTAFDLTPDDQRLLFVRQAESQAQAGPEIILVQNWFQELEATVGR